MKFSTNFPGSQADRGGYGPERRSPPDDDPGFRRRGNAFKMNPTVWCVIPVHNRQNLTRRCLGYLNAQDYRPLQVIVVDDGSTDGTGEFLAQTMQPNLTVLKGNGALWWGGAMQMGVEYVARQAGTNDYLLMLNDDVRIEPDYVSRLVEEGRSRDDAIVGSVQRSEESAEMLNCGYQIDYWRMQIVPCVCGDAAPIHALVGRGVLFPMGAIRSTGGLRPALFRHYFADLEYTARLRERGWSLFTSDRAPVFSSAVSADEEVRARGAWSSLFSVRSKTNVISRLLFFTTRGPWWARVTVVPRYLLLRLWNLIRKLGIAGRSQGGRRGEARER